MAQISVNIDDKRVKLWVNDLIKKTPVELKKTVQRVTAKTLRDVKTKFPKRSGKLIQAYLSKKINDYAYLIFSKLKYADDVEVGTSPHTITPKKKKYLTVPIKSSVLTGTKARIKQSALDLLFSELDNRAGRTKKQIYEEVGIILTKKVNHPGSKGKFIIRDKVAPSARRLFMKEIRNLFERYGFR